MENGVCKSWSEKAKEDNKPPVVHITLVKMTVYTSKKYVHFDPNESLGRQEVCPLSCCSRNTQYFLPDG